MNTFNQMPLRFSNILFFILLALPVQADERFRRDFSNLFVYHDTQIENFTKASIQFNSGKLKANSEWVIQTDTNGITLDVNELYADVFVNSGYFTLGKQKIVSGQSYFYNPTNFIHLGEVNDYSYPQAIKYFNRDGINLLKYTQLFDGASWATTIYPEEKSLQFEVSKNVYAEHFDIAAKIYWDDEAHFKFGLNASKLLNDNTLLYAEAAYAKQVRFDNYILPDNIYIISGLQYTTTSGYSINAEYYYHNKTLESADIIAAQGSLPEQALYSMASKGNLLFFNVRDIALSEHINLDFSYTKGLSESIDIFSPSLHFRVTDNVDIYGKTQLDLHNHNNHTWFLGLKAVW